MEYTKLRFLGIIVVLIISFGADAEIKKVRVGEFEIAYTIKGKGKHTVLLEGGASASVADWGDIPNSIAKTARVVTYARVGNGQSTAIRRNFSAEDYAGHLSLFLKNIGVNEPIVHVAHSYGGVVARVFAANYPSQVKALLLVDPSSEHDVDIMRNIDLEQANREIARVKLADMKDGMPNFYLDFWSKRPLPDYPQIADIPVTVIASIKKYEEPEHLLHSDKGREAWGKLHQEWANSFPQGKSVLTDKSYHLIPQEEPELVLNEINALLLRTK